VIRRVNSAEWPLCRTLLPHAFERDAGELEGWLAIAEKGLRVSGAAVARYEGSVAWVELCVVPTDQRRGVGTELLQVMASAASARGAVWLRVLCGKESFGSIEFLLATGFRVRAASAAAGGFAMSLPADRMCFERRL
jgi:GNAT superfamily N-acetyltransferase